MAGLGSFRAVKAFGQWIRTNPLDTASIIACVAAAVLSIAGLVGQAVVNVAILAVFMVIIVHLVRLGEVIAPSRLATTVADAVRAELPAPAGSTKLIEDQKALYDHVTHLARSTNPARPSSRIIQVGSTRRLTAEKSTTERTDQLINACIERVADGWRVYRVITVTSLERLEHELGRYVPPSDEGTYQLKVMLRTDAPSLAPLVIGRTHAVLGNENAHGAGVENAILMHDQEGVEFVETYFERVWNLPSARLLIDDGKTDSDVVAWVRQALADPDEKTSGSIDTPA